MKCEFDYEITLKALNILHQDILLGDAEGQVADLEALVQLVRYFARSGRSTLAEEAENLERAIAFLTVRGELRQCRFPEISELPGKSVERFSVFNACYAALRQGIWEGRGRFALRYDRERETLMVEDGPIHDKPDFG